MKKSTVWTLGSLLAVGLGMGSCLTQSDELDLDKEISLDMQIGAGGMSLPIGSLSKIYIDSLLKVDSDFDLDTLAGGLYGFTISDKIDKVQVNVDPISINIPSPTIPELSTDFDNPLPNDITVPTTSDGTVIEIATVNIDAINNAMPGVTSSFRTDNYNVPGTGISIPVSLPVSISEQTINFDFDYDIPTNIGSINTAWFGPVKYSKAGQVLTLNVDLSGIYNLVNSPMITVQALNIEFPSEFSIQKDGGLDSYISPSCVTAAGNIFTIGGAVITGLSAENSTLPVTFNVNSADFSSYTGSINFTGNIKYSLSLLVEGEISYTGTRSFQVGVSIAENLKLAEVNANSNNISFNIGDDKISSSYTVTGMENISAINSLTFKEDESSVFLSISDLDIDPFTFSSDETVYIQFQPELEFSGNCVDEDGTTVGNWDPSVPGKLSLDLNKAYGHTMTLNVKSLDLSKNTIDKVSKSMTVQNEISYGGNLVIAAKSDISLKDAEKLGNRNLNVSVWGSLVIDNARLTTEAVSTELKDSAVISINEKVDASLIALKKVDLVNPAGIDMKLIFNGVPASLPSLSFQNVRILFPDFIKMSYTGSDSRISLSGTNTLIINGELEASELTGSGFAVKNLKIDGIEFADEVATKDGRLILEDLKVLIEGSLSADNFEVESKDLDEVSASAIISIDPVVVKSVYGKIAPEIDPIHQSLGISLGDDMDFFKNGNNQLSLSNPEIVLNLNSTVTIPMLASMSISSKDSEGKYIAKDITPDGGVIRIPACAPDAAERSLVLVVYKNERRVSDSSDTVYVRISRLDELMTTVPDSITFDMTITSDQSVSHYVDLTRELSVSGQYNVNVPLSFDNLLIEYSDTISLSGDFDEISENVIGDVTLQVKADLESTVPFGVQINAQALDEAGKVIPDIIINPVEVKPGTTAGSTSQVLLSLTVKNGSIQALDALKITAQLNSASASALGKGQYLWLKNIVLVIPNGVVVDLTDQTEDL